MAYTTITKSTDYFNTILYSGTGGTQVLTGVGFESTFNWIKRRDNAAEFRMIDQVRGGNYSIGSGTNDPQLTQTNAISAWSSDGFTVGATSTNPSSSTFVAWNWKGNGAGSANTAGSINSTVSVSTTSGFSVVKYTGNASAGATVGHGLGAVPKMIIVKNLDAYKSWQVYHSSLGASKILVLDTTAAQDTAGNRWNNVAPTNTVFTLGNADEVNGSVPNIAYCFSEKEGYSKFGNYTGNGSTDGTFVYTGFKPAFVIIKNTGATVNWLLKDNKRPSYQNINDTNIYPNVNAVEETSNDTDFLSNGFKARNTGSYQNASGNNYIYMAFASEPLVGDNPATAR